MSLDKALKNLKFDKRLTEYHLNRGLLQKEELEKHLKALEDVGDRVDLVRMGSQQQDKNTYN
jgi:hypothetical protein